MIKLEKVPVIFHKIEIDLGRNFDIDTPEGEQLYEKIQDFIEQNIILGEWWDGLELNPETGIAELSQPISDEDTAMLEAFLSAL